MTPLHSDRRLLLRYRVIPVSAATAIGFVVLVLLRGHSMLSNSLFNPDEAVVLAWGKRATIDILPYKAYTTSDMLFLWPAFMGFLGDMGIPLTLPTAHVLSGLFYLYISMCGWYAFYRRHGWKWATAIIAPVALYLFAGFPSYSSDFLSLGTELLPIGILVTAALILFPSEQKVSSLRFGFGCALSGLAMWATLQAALLAVALVVSAICVRWLENFRLSPHIHLHFRQLWSATLLAAIAFVVPSAISLIELGVTGELGAFWHESLTFTFHYAGSTNVAEASDLQRVAAVGIFIAGFPIAGLWLIAGALGASDLPTDRTRREQVLEFVAWIAPVVGAVATLLALSHLYTHYANYLYAGALLSGIVGCRVTRYEPTALGKPGVHSRKWVPLRSRVLGSLTLLVASVVILAISNSAWDDAAFLSHYVPNAISTGSLPPINYYYYGPSYLQNWCPANSRVQVWGWAAELYSYYNWVPATRYVTTDWLIYNYGDQKYVRERFIAELRADPPACIVQAVGNKFFAIPGHDTLTSVIPAVRPLLRSCYVRRESEVGSVAGGPEYFQHIWVYLRSRPC